MKLRKWYIIPYVVCTVWFLYSPHLHLSKANPAYYEYAIRFGSCTPLTEWMLDDLKFFNVMRAYLLLLAIITLLFFMIKMFHGKTTAIAAACAGMFLHVVAYYTELYPSIGMVGLVWSNDGISQNDPVGIFTRYH